jgi:hypothetical protein
MNRLGGGPWMSVAGASRGCCFSPGKAPIKPDLAGVGQTVREAG